MARSSSTIIRFSRFAPSIWGRLGMVAIAVVIADHLFLQSNSLELSGTHPRVAAAVRLLGCHDRAHSAGLRSPHAAQRFVAPCSAVIHCHAVLVCRIAPKHENAYSHPFPRL